MMSLIDFLKTREGLICSGGKDEECILKAEEKLGLVFAKEYRKYLAEFGSVVYDDHELTGLNRSKRLNVVDCTLAQREENDVIPSDMYVVEDIGIDGVIVLQKSNGRVYMLFSYDNEISKEADSLLEYLEKNN